MRRRTVGRRTGASICAFVALSWTTGVGAAGSSVQQAGSEQSSAPKRPAASPGGRSAVEVGGRYVDSGRLNLGGRYIEGKWIEIGYGRPLKRGRDLFGPADFVEFLNDGAEVWRAGANYTTQLETEVALDFGQGVLAPGEYTVFIELGRNDWTLILSTWPAQKIYDYENKEALFGAYYYTPDKDVARVSMRLQERPYSSEQLSWQFLDTTDHGGRLALFWDHKMASVPFRIVGDNTAEADDGDGAAFSGDVAAGETPSQSRQASPRGFSAAQVGGEFDERAGYVGGKWIEIEYGRPLKRGRSLFGAPDFFVKLNDGAPVWRAGANQSTQLTTEVRLVIGDTTVEPGEHTVFIQLMRNQWTFILSRWPAQKSYDQHDRTALFGAYHYRPHKDVVRIEMELEEMPYSSEQLSWQFLDMSDKGGRLAIFWDHKMASVPFVLVEDD